MLFTHKSLFSIYDFEHELPDEYANLNVLAKEIQRMTTAIYELWKEGEIVFFNHTNSLHQRMYVDFHHVSEHTWHRDITEIKELLYRKEKENGEDQPQFSISKALKKINIYKPEEIDKEYKHYLQLLYFFYMINYFAYPRTNIFKQILHEDHFEIANANYRIEDNYLSFILQNLFDNTETSLIFLSKHYHLTQISLRVSRQIDCIFSKHIYPPDKLSQYILEHFYQLYELPYEPMFQRNVYQILVDYCYGYMMQVYALDLLRNMMDDTLYTFEALKIPPYEAWKQHYIYLDEIDLFLREQEIHWFIRQEKKNIASRDKIKFLKSNVVVFLKQLIDYDLYWIKEQEEEGMFIEENEYGYKIHALKLVIILKTYHDLTNIKKVRIISPIVQPLKSILSNSKIHTLFPPNIIYRFFILIAHAKYLHATTHQAIYQSIFKVMHLIPEEVNMKMFYAIYTHASYDKWYVLLLYTNNLLYTLFDDDDFIHYM